MKKTIQTKEQADCQLATTELCLDLREKNQLAFDILFATFEKAYSAEKEYRSTFRNYLSNQRLFMSSYEMLDTVWVECLMELRQPINTERAENEYCGRFGFDIFTDEFYDALTNIACASPLTSIARANA